MTQGTPGPWVVETHKTEYPDIFTYNVMAPKGWREDTKEYRCCSVATGLDCPHDATLIAAAPDMLAALRQIAEQPCDHGPQEFCPRELAQAALAKTEERNTGWTPESARRRVGGTFGT